MIIITIKVVSLKWDDFRITIMAIIFAENIIIGGSPLMFDIVVNASHRFISFFMFFIFMDFTNAKVINSADE